MRGARLLLALLISGTAPASAAAPAVRARLSAPSTTSRVPAVPASAARALVSAPSALPALSPAAAPLSSPLAPAAAHVAPAAAVASPVEALPAPAAPAEDAAAGGARDFALRATGETLASGDGAPAGPAATAASARGFAALAAPSQRTRPVAAPIPAAPTKAEGEKRGAGFPLALAALSGVAWAALSLGQRFAPLAAQGDASTAGATALWWAAASALLVTGALAVNAAADAALYSYAMWRGRGMTDARFAAFLRAEVMEGRLDGNAAALVKAYRPSSRVPDFTFAFASRGSVWVRPELAAVPWLFRIVLLHELHHLRSASPRGPPGFIRGAARELRSRAVELKGPAALAKVKVPALERALLQAQTSLRLARPYDLLVLNPGGEELKDPRLYEAVSGGAARVTSADADALAELAKEGRKWRAVVLGGASKVLPAKGSRDALRLEAVLQQLDSLHVLAQRLAPRGPARFRAGSDDERSFKDLVDRAARVRESGSPKAAQQFEKEVRKLWHQIASQRLKGVELGGLMEGLYKSLRDRGLAVLPFGPEERGVMEWQRLLRYWEAADGGQFKVTRVDLEDGGHALVLRKAEQRVGLWLRPIRGGRIATSIPNASFSEEGTAAARKALEDAGFGGQLKNFDEHDVVVRHVFGADVGRQEIYVTVPRAKKSVISRFGGHDADVYDSQANFEPHLMDAAELQGVKPLWQLGVTGAAGSILWVDTGADASHEDFMGRLDVVDMVDEGPEDWMGHGTHVAGISISGSAAFPGMAKDARGIMAKVFSRDQAAADGEIMGAGAIALKRGSDVVNLSLGQRGSSADNLADFFSGLTKVRNALGQFLIVLASAGNAGPFDKTLSQPGAGVDVIAVAAAAKSLDDGRPEMAFYSSVGPDLDRRFAVRRLRLKPDLTAIGGDVTSEPGSRNVYKHGVFSAKSKDAARADSDHDDGRHTGMSGTSMASPSAAGIALLVKLAIKLSGANTPFVEENLAFAVKAVLSRTATDLGVPMWFQGAGLIHAWQAASLAASAGVRALGSRAGNLLRWATGRERAAPERSWAWLERLKSIEELEDRVYLQAELAKSQVQSRDEDGESEADSEVHPLDRQASGNLAQAEAQRRFNAARTAELPKVLEALKDDVWLVRRRAALVLLNFKAPGAVMPLAEAALNDPDARVRQAAFLALAETPSHAADALLKQAAATAEGDRGVYAAYALSRRGDRSAVGRVIRELGSPEKSARFTAAWLLGQLGMRASAEEAEALSGRVRDGGERGNVRHLAAASLTNLADSAPGAISDRVVMDLLSAAGPENLALTRTISKFFPAALNSPGIKERVRAEPLRSIVTDFVLRNRDAVTRPGALGELVQRLAKASSIPLDAPTAPPDPSGAGVAGVDEIVGPLDLLALPPAGAPEAFADGGDALASAAAEAGLDAATLAKFETGVRAALPLSGALWLSVPAHKLYALTLALEHRGWRLRRALPFYPSARGGSAGPGTYYDAAGPAPAPDADLSLVRVGAADGVSELAVMSALERVAARARGRGPVVVSLGLSAPTTRRTPVSALLERLASEGVGVVLGSGNGGPRNGTASAPSDAALTAVVAAASREKGLQFYSGRGVPEAARIAWTELVDHLEPGQAVDELPGRFGTGFAAERAAEKLADLARIFAAAMAEAKLELPEGWFDLLMRVVREAAAPMPGHGAHEVGAGLFDAPERAAALLRERLSDPAAAAREAGEARAAAIAAASRK